MSYSAEYLKVMQDFEVPEQFFDQARQMLTDSEIKLMALMGRAVFSAADLASLIRQNFEANLKPERLILTAYNRANLNKVYLDAQESQIGYQINDFYDRLSYFSQYEPLAYLALGRSQIDALEQWNLAVYLEHCSQRIVKKASGANISMHNSILFAADEAEAFIDSVDVTINIQPCNCRTVALHCDKPKNVCLQFGDDINWPLDRGHGVVISKAEAKALTRACGKQGMMRTGEGGAICHCDGCCCFPFRAAAQLGTFRKWPQARHELNWDAAKCTNCGACLKVCNFNCFSKDDQKKIRFDRTNCWGCTICAEVCKFGAISYT